MITTYADQEVKGQHFRGLATSYFGCCCSHPLVSSHNDRFGALHVISCEDAQSPSRCAVVKRMRLEDNFVANGPERSGLKADHTAFTLGQIVEQREITGTLAKQLALGMTCPSRSRTQTFEARTARGRPRY
jgi:hypothetical protein